MKLPLRGPRGPWFGALLGLALLALCFWTVADDLLYPTGPDRTLPSLLGEGVLTGPLGQRLAWFAGAVLTVHLLLGLLAWALARLTARVWPRLPLGERTLTALWLLALATWVLCVNGNEYPASVFAANPDEYHELHIPWAALATGLGLLVGGALLLTLLRWAASHGLTALLAARTRPVVWLAGGALLAAGLSGSGSLWGGADPHRPRAVASATGSTGRPRAVILIGIDSLRCDLTVGPATAGATPRIAAFLQGAQRFQDATTPLARTFPAWVSIVSGKHPVTTGARVNLVPRSSVHAGETLPTMLANLGYRTVYATDEVRFANIDRSYGFDQVVTPPVGASDFLLGKLNDLPLSNVLSPTPVARWLFPQTYGNRAAYVTYRPRSYEDLLERGLPDDRPLFLALHLTLAHWPYSRAGQPATRSQPRLLRSAYADAVREVDAQFGRVMQLLRDRGLLDDALVVVFSDHGEGLGFRSESLLQDVRQLDELWGSVWGHGTSVMTPHQFQVLLAFRGYGPHAFASGGGTSSVPASLEDLLPTLAELVGAGRPPGLDGQSLAPVLLGRETPASLANRIRFTETDFNIPSVRKGQFDEKAALREAGSYYEIDRASGWVQLRRERIPDIIAAKERAAFDSEMLLAAVPGRSGGHDYFITQRQRPVPARLYGRPRAEQEPQAARLWDALHARFPGELVDPALAVAHP